MRVWKSLGGAGLGLALAALGLLLVFYAGRTLYHHVAATRWPSTTGTVVSSGIARGRYPRLEVFCQYRVGGADYFNGDRYYYYFWAVPERVPSDYLPGSVVRVYYNPHDPGVSVLVPGFDWGEFVRFGVGLYFTILGLALSGLWPRGKTKAAGCSPAAEC